MAVDMSRGSSRLKGVANVIALSAELAETTEKKNVENDQPIGKEFSATE